ncbi:pyridoxal-phosphate dependent enzyme [Psychroserpens sp.]|uniref:pyridoxal-phosphate dependent enzyme n=1 Tax=Psychroserpens sp. TaxID=2020870 RepID=UPI001B0B648A|nr:pyridoxal-phosphate dependent enzyme [Psychroserpens sp.]MBO6606836.1 pyridoxal-phosphate dependent enzyme [Psychroserpens sp.]MBO6653539.1 pyridoxal-phosphate dependent enzyme [Psychroserpens sp.]MBO6680433.1 pyridoxal-phosphate dependent enzyme [Psychroserpens sp.]MBO6750608.1 pyridoxal-phosphate dependent enzyme [Psychroserpens sp.]MBO6915091.1 pyridoxal-phosphate dependent enzyme [Psychroserpens sp.]
MTKKDLIDCYNRIAPYIHKTPVLTSELVNELVGANLYFKCENFQKTGAYKMRGATNAIMQLSDQERSKGVVTHSSGNFAQSLSKAAQSLGVKATIVMPSNSPNAKKEGVKTYGGHIIECEPTIEARQGTADKIAEATGATFIHPSNDLDVILGQGTACYELLTDFPDINVVVCPVGGGGLIAGSAIAAHHLTDNCIVIGGEPFEADDAYRSLLSGKIETNETANTIADGLRTQLGHHNFPIIKTHVNRIIRVTESEIIEAMRFIWERMKILIEPSSAVTFAAVLKDKDQLKDLNIGIIISGGNVDVTNLPF